MTKPFILSARWPQHGLHPAFCDALTCAQILMDGIAYFRIGILQRFLEFLAVRVSVLGPSFAATYFPADRFDIVSKKACRDI